jgi:hypothetical protein
MFTFLLGEVFPPGVRTSEKSIAAFKNSPMGVWYNPVRFNVHQKSGNFGPWENPEAYITDICRTFRPSRKQPDRCDAAKLKKVDRDDIQARWPRRRRAVRDGNRLQPALRQTAAA